MREGAGGGQTSETEGTELTIYNPSLSTCPDASGEAELFTAVNAISTKMERALQGTTLPSIQNTTTQVEVESIAAATARRRMTATAKANRNARTATVRERSASGAASKEAFKLLKNTADSPRRQKRSTASDGRAAELALGTTVAASIAREEEKAKAYFTALSEVTSSQAASANGFNMSQVQDVLLNMTGCWREACTWKMTKVCDTAIFSFLVLLNL